MADKLSNSLSDAIANVASAVLNQLQGNSLTIVGTLGGDVLSAIRDAPNGLRFYMNSNSPANRPSGCDWGAYLFIRNDTSAAAIYFDNSHLAFSYGINISAATSITWKIIS